jgi:Protein affecting phage T7 exclusion by the F plasmid
LFTAVTGVYFAKLAGISTIRSGIGQLVRNEVPVYELISGAAIAFAALLLIIPGFLTDVIGFLLIIPFTRKFILKNLSSKFQKTNIQNNVIEGEFEDDDKKK